MRTRSKKTKTVNNNTPQPSEENNNCVNLPLDILIEIIGRLPVKSVVRFLTVSKLWETTIRSREFVQSFPLGSSSQPRTVIAHARKFSGKFGKHQKLLFLSLSSSPSTSVLSHVTCPLPYPGRIEFFYHHVNGLISLGYGQEQMITNPSTGQSIILPRCKTRRRVVKSFFGYDSVDDQYKVLCMTEKLYGRGEEASSQHQVLTVGAKKESWRMIDCSTPHRPWSNGVCIDGVVYYIAKTGSEMLQRILMRFDLRSEELVCFSILPAEIQSAHLFCKTLITYEGKVAIPTNRTSNTIDVSVIDQDAHKHEWLMKKTFTTQSLKNGFRLHLRGTTHTGNFILAPSFYSDHYYVVHFNPDTNVFTEIKFSFTKSRPDPCYVSLLFFTDYVESVRLLSKRQFMI